MHPFPTRNSFEIATARRQVSVWCVALCARGVGHSNRLRPHVRRFPGKSRLLSRALYAVYNAFQMIFPAFFFFIVILKSNSDLTNKAREHYNKHPAPGPPGPALVHFCF